MLFFTGRHLTLTAPLRRISRLKGEAAATAEEEGGCQTLKGIGGHLRWFGGGVVVVKAGEASMMMLRGCAVGAGRSQVPDPPLSLE